jgi:hypothetical protein
MFANVFPFNMKKSEYTSPDGDFTIDIGVDKDTAKLVKSWSGLYKFKDTDDYGEDYQSACQDDVKYVTFKRNNVVRGKKGQILEEFSGPPKVVDADGKPFPDETHIGNGSVCTIKLNVYKGGGSNDKGKQIPFVKVRLDGVRVEELVAYEGNTEGSIEEEDVYVHGDTIPF